MPNEMRIPGYRNADMFFTIDRWMSEYIEMIGDLIGKKVRAPYERSILFKDSVETQGEH